MTQPIAVAREVLVLGSAPEAARVVRELLGLAYRVHWVSEHAIPEQHPALYTYEGMALAALQGHVGGFRATLQRDGQEVAVGAAALVVATGNERYFPAELCGVPNAGRVLSLAQVEEQLAIPRHPRLPPPHCDERLLVLLDYRSETRKEMAAHALRLVSRMRREWRCELGVLYRELQVDSYGVEQLTRDQRQQGIVFCRYGDVDIALDDRGVTLDYAEGTVRGDWLVLPEAVRPTADTPQLAALLRVRVGGDGYFQEVNIHQHRPGLSNRRGIFYAGRCHLDADEEEALADAALTAASVDALLGSGFIQPDAVHADVNKEQCIRCLTCVRSCPHAAVEIADYGDVVAARVAELACQGCGVCVCNCPVRAIELVGQVAPAWTLRD